MDDSTRDRVLFGFGAFCDVTRTKSVQAATPDFVQSAQSGPFWSGADNPLPVEAQGF